MSSRLILAVIAAAVLFGTTGTAQALSGVDANPIAIGAGRIVVGGAILGAIAAFKARRGNVAVVSLGRAQAVGLVALGALGVVAYQPAFFAGTRLNGVALGTVLALGSAPVFTGVADAILRRSLPTVRWMAATALAVLGVSLIGLAGGDHRLTPTGLAASLGAGAAYSVYTLASKRLLEAGASSSATMGAVFGTAALMSLPILALAGAGWIASAHGTALVLWLGLVTTALAYVLFGRGLRGLSAPTVSTLTLVEPLTATLLGLMVLGERLTAQSVGGLAALAMGLVILATVRTQPNVSRAET